MHGLGNAVVDKYIILSTVQVHDPMPISKAVETIAPQHKVGLLIVLRNSHSSVIEHVFGMQKTPDSIPGFPIKDSWVASTVKDHSLRPWRAVVNPSRLYRLRWTIGLAQYKAISYIHRFPRHTANYYLVNLKNGGGGKSHPVENRDVHHACN